MSHCDRILHALGRQRWGSRIVQDGDCWLWTGSRNAQGYATVHYDSRSWLLHRLFFQADGRRLDERILHHTCQKKNCINPSHLEPITRGDHVELHDYAGLRSGWDLNRSKTHCAQGHEFTPENTSIIPRASGFKRRCRTCSREWDRAYKVRRAVDLPPPGSPVPPVEQLTVWDAV